LNLYGFAENRPVSACDPLGLDWKVERQGFGFAKASRGIPSDSIDSLVKDVNLNFWENLEWARKDSMGTRFKNDAEPDCANELYIPNTVITMLPDIPRFDHWWEWTIPLWNTRAIT
jgi:hypothetical protein